MRRGHSRSKSSEKIPLWFAMASDVLPASWKIGKRIIRNAKARRVTTNSPREFSQSDDLCSVCSIDKWQLFSESDQVLVWLLAGEFINWSKH